MYDRPNTDRLWQMLESQRELQLVMPPEGRDPADLEGAERIQFYKDMKLALEAELQEMMDEMSWKPWASAVFFNKEAVQGEIIDAWHFLMNLWLATGGTDAEFFEQYLEKRDRNAQRQAEGYDGVSTKCPLCKRAIDDRHVKCKLPLDHPPTGVLNTGWCDIRRETYMILHTNNGDEVHLLSSN